MTSRVPVKKKKSSNESVVGGGSRKVGPRPRGSDLGRDVKRSSKVKDDLDNRIILIEKRGDYFGCNRSYVRLRRGEGRRRQKQGGGEKGANTKDQTGAGETKRKRGAAVEGQVKSGKPCGRGIREKRPTFDPQTRKKEKERGSSCLG